MPKPSPAPRVPTLRELQPDELAREVTDAFAEHLEPLAIMLDQRVKPTDEPFLYNVVRSLARYARSGGDLPARTSVEKLIAQLSPLYSSMLGGERSPLDVEPPEPTSALGVAIHGANARAKLEAGEPLSSPELALLVGINRDYLTAMVSRDEVPSCYRDDKLPRRPYRFRVTKALREWMAERGA